MFRTHQKASALLFGHVIFGRFGLLIGMNGYGPYGAGFIYVFSLRMPVIWKNETVVRRV